MHIGKAKLSIRVLGITMGSLLAIHLGALCLLGMFGVGQEYLQALSSLFIGLSPDIAGIVIGSAWGFLIGGLTGMLFAWLYNKML